jgi:hypothetical protein
LSLKHVQLEREVFPVGSGLFQFGFQHGPVSLITVQVLAQEVTGHPGRQDADEADADNHQHHGHSLPEGCDRVVVSVTDGGNGHGGRPQPLAEVVDVAARGGKFGHRDQCGGSEDDHGHGQQDEVQSLVRQQSFGPTDASGQDHPNPDQTGQPCHSQGTEEGDGDDEQVQDVRFEKLRAAGRQIQLDQILQDEQRPHHVVDDGEGFRHRPVNRNDEGDDQDRKPGDGDHHKRDVYDSREPIVCVLGPGQSRPPRLWTVRGSHGPRLQRTLNPQVKAGP